jgi:hypothetical protein
VSAAVNDLTDAHFAESHQRRIDSDQATVWRALSQLRFEQLPITRALLAIRHLRSQPLPLDRPLFMDGPVQMLVLDAPNYALGGAIIQPWRRGSVRYPVASLADFAEFDEPGWAKCLTDFDLAPVNNATLLTTSTRVYCTDADARRRFRRYWLLIRGGSGLIRRDMLATVDRLACSAGG